MKINITYSNINYTIDADGASYTLIRHGVNQDKKSTNFGNPTESILGHFSNMPNAIGRVIKDGLGSSEETISLSEYVKRIESAKAELFKAVEA